MYNLRYPFVFCDIDDTLLNNDRCIDLKNKTEILRYTQSGGNFILTTGRNYFAAKKIYDNLHLNTPIIVNQGCIFSPAKNQWTYRQTLNRTHLINLCRFLEDHNTYFQLFSQNKIFVKEKTDYSHNFIKNCGVFITETNMSLSKFLTLSQCDIEKLMIEECENFIDDLYMKLQQLFGSYFAIEKSKSWIIEISDPLNIKGEAIKNMLKYSNTSKSHCMAIGDSQSDLSMFEQVGMAIAVANAHESVLSRADAITKSNNDAGVGFALEQYAYY